MKKIFFAAALFAALSFGFVSCENPDDEPGFSLENERGDDKNPDEGVTPPITLEEPMLVTTGGATDVEYSSVTLWGRLNTDTLVFFPKVKWGVEYSASKEEITTHSGKEALCTTKLVGENADEFSVKLTGVGYGKMLYYNAYLLINDIKYVYGEVDSVHMDVKLTLKTNNNDYGTVTGSGTYDHLAEVTITATLKENYYFAGWSDSDSKELSRTITLTSDTTITANFSLNPCLTVQVNNSNYGTVTGSGLYEKGTEATITATPKANCYFTSWSDGVADNPRTVVVNSDTTFTANFSLNPRLTVQANNSNYGTVTGSGLYEKGTEATITATPKANCYFTSWSDGVADNPRTVVVNSDTTFTANFSLNPRLTVQANNSNYGTVTGSGLYEVGTKVTITATPKGNYYFTGWSDSDSKELTRTVQVKSDTTITANFAKKPYLTAKSNSSNYGTVTGSGYYEVGSEATITATPKENYYFTGWSDSDSKELTRTVQVNSNTTITANFAKKPYLTAKSNSSDYGTVTGSGYYDVGAEVTITATPKENYYFTGWSDSDSKELSRTITIISDATITANFAKKPYLTANPNSSDYGTVTGSGYYEPNTEVAITAIPNYDYIEFVQWSDGNTGNPRTVTVTSDVTYTATFKVNLPDGAFLVNSSGKCVVFSSGNLQYTQSTNTWSFAENQWDYIGTDNVTGGSVESDPTYGDSKEGTALADKIDLFGWSTSAANFGVSTSTDKNDYLGSFVDWGTNQIGSDTPNTWRTLTEDEWSYLHYERPNYSNLRGVAQVNGVNGLILLPDSWTCPDGITFKSGFHDDHGVEYYAAYQTFTANQWSKMEQAGAVFLPAAGYRSGSDVYRVQRRGYYWSATDGGSDYPSYRYFGSDGAYMNYRDRYYGQSVRLVKDL